MPNTLTVDLASLNKDQFQRIWNVIFGEPEIDYKHAHEVDKAVLAKRDAEIRKLEAEIRLLKRDAEDAYKRGYSEGKDAGREDVYEQLPISDVDSLHKAALAVCDADNEPDSSAAKSRLGTAMSALANAACWSPKLSPEDAEASKRRRGPFLSFDFEEPTSADAFSNVEKAEAAVRRAFENVLGEYGFVSTVYGYEGDGPDSGERHYAPPLKVKILPTSTVNSLLRYDTWEGHIDCIDPYWNVEIVDERRPDMRSCWIAGRTVLYARHPQAGVHMHGRQKPKETPPSAPEGVVAALEDAAKTFSVGHSDEPVPRFTAHEGQAEPKERFYITDNKTGNDFVVGFPSYESATEVIRRMEAGCLDPNMIVPGSEFLLITNTSISVLLPSGHRESIHFPAPPRRYPK